MSSVIIKRLDPGKDRAHEYVSFKGPEYQTETPPPPPPPHMRLSNLCREQSQNQAS